MFLSVMVGMIFRYSRGCRHNARSSRCVPDLGRVTHIILGSRRFAILAASFRGDRPNRWNVQCDRPRRLLNFKALARRCSRMSRVTGVNIRACRSNTPRQFRSDFHAVQTSGSVTSATVGGPGHDGFRPLFSCEVRVWGWRLNDVSPVCPGRSARQQWLRGCRTAPRATYSWRFAFMARTVPGSGCRVHAAAWGVM